MTVIDADNLLEQITTLAAQIKTYEDERDALVACYKGKITIAENICDEQTREQREQIAALTEQLRRFAAERVSDNAPDFLKVKTVESADWSNFKKQLIIDGDNAFFKDTGELVDGLTVQQFPDEFTVKTGGI